MPDKFLSSSSNQSSAPSVEISELKRNIDSIGSQKQDTIYRGTRSLSDISARSSLSSTTFTNIRIRAEIGDQSFYLGNTAALGAILVNLAPTSGAINSNNFKWDLQFYDDVNYNKTGMIKLSSHNTSGNKFGTLSAASLQQASTYTTSVNTNVEFNDFKLEVVRYHSKHKISCILYQPYSQTYINAGFVFAFLGVGDPAIFAMGLSLSDLNTVLGKTSFTSLRDHAQVFIIETTTPPDVVTSIPSTPPSLPADLIGQLFGGIGNYATSKDVFMIPRYNGNVLLTTDYYVALTDNQDSSGSSYPYLYEANVNTGASTLSIDIPSSGSHANSVHPDETIIRITPTEVSQRRTITLDDDTQVHRFALTFTEQVPQGTTVKLGHHDYANFDEYVSSNGTTNFNTYQHAGQGSDDIYIRKTGQDSKGSYYLLYYVQIVGGQDIYYYFRFHSGLWNQSLAVSTSPTNAEWYLPAPTT